MRPLAPAHRTWSCHRRATSHVRKVTAHGRPPPFLRVGVELREALGIGAGSDVVFERSDDSIVVRKAVDPTRGRKLAERLRGTWRCDPDRRDHGVDPGGLKVSQGTLVDSNVLLDILTEDDTWVGWSVDALADAAETGPLFIDRREPSRGRPTSSSARPAPSPTSSSRPSRDTGEPSRLGGATGSRPPAGLASSPVSLLAPAPPIVRRAGGGGHRR